MTQVTKMNESPRDTLKTLRRGRLNERVNEIVASQAISGHVMSEDEVTELRKRLAVAENLT